MKLRAPLPKPGNIVCMAVNYMENGTRKEPAPINAFHKAPTSILETGGTMILPDVPATIFEGEAEMALVIGKRASHVKAADAMNYVFGYMNFIDGSARGIPPQSFFAMKSRDTFAPIGPYLVTADEIHDPHKVPIKLWVNGEVKQDFNTDDMAHNIPRCIEWVTSIHTLEPGDILATGTNHRGLSSFMDGDTWNWNAAVSASSASRCATNSSASGRVRRAWIVRRRASTRRRRRSAGSTRRRNSAASCRDGLGLLPQAVVAEQVPPMSPFAASQAIRTRPGPSRIPGPRLSTMAVPR